MKKSGQKSFTLAKEKLNKMENKTKNTFIAMGIVFMGSGVVFISTLNKIVGFGALALGIVYLAVGILGQKK